MTEIQKLVTRQVEAIDEVNSQNRMNPFHLSLQLSLRADLCRCSKAESDTISQDFRRSALTGGGKAWGASGQIGALFTNDSSALLASEGFGRHSEFGVKHAGICRKVLRTPDF